MAKDKGKKVFQSNFLIILLIIVSFFTGYLFFKVRSLENKNSASNVNNTEEAKEKTQSTPLSITNLKKYAQELGLDRKKFDACLDSGKKKSVIDKDVAQAGRLGVRGTPGFFINGRFVAGAFPIESFKEIIDKELANKGSNRCSDYKDPSLKGSCDENGNKAFNPVPVKVDVTGAPMRGNPKAEVTIIEFSDFECPFCARAFPVVKQLFELYPNKIKFYYKHFPLTNIHSFAQKAAEASLCALDQGKFWPYHDKLFNAQIREIKKKNPNFL